jgi:hypothetical protein
MSHEELTTMGAPPVGDRDLALVDELVRQITADAHSDEEKLQAFRQALEDRAAAPCDGFVIGELSLGDHFSGVLPWGYVDNRPFLRCLHGSGLCCWRLGRLEEAACIFDRMLWLNPSDNQGVRCLIGELRAKRSWEDHREKG